MTHADALRIQATAATKHTRARVLSPDPARRCGRPDAHAWRVSIAPHGRVFTSSVDAETYLAHFLGA